MFRAGEWLSIAVLGLVVLFIFNSIAFFTFLIGPERDWPNNHRRTIHCISPIHFHVTSTGNRTFIFYKRII